MDNRIHTTKQYSFFNEAKCMFWERVSKLTEAREEPANSKVEGQKSSLRNQTSELWDTCQQWNYCTPYSVPITYNLNYLE